MPASSPTPIDPTQRFSSRVDDYIKYRPTYPPGVVDLLAQHAALTPNSTVADVGAGTGISARPLLALGCTVFAVEPNADMRAAAEALLTSRYPTTFHPVDGRAEDTTLEAASVDLVLCAQAFHWFDRPRAAAEFRRILRTPGRVAVLFNERERSSTPFLIGYDDLLTRYGTDYTEVAKARPVDEAELGRLFGGRAARYSLPNTQTLDWAGLRGRIMSASYAPLPGQPKHDDLLAGLRELFDRCQTDGIVRIAYETELFVAEPA